MCISITPPSSWPLCALLSPYFALLPYTPESPLRDIHMCVGVDSSTWTWASSSVSEGNKFNASCPGSPPLEPREPLAARAGLLLTDRTMVRAHNLRFSEFLRAAALSCVETLLGNNPPHPRLWWSWYRLLGIAPRALAGGDWIKTLNLVPGTSPLLIRHTLASCGSLYQCLSTMEGASLMRDESCTKLPRNCVYSNLITRTCMCVCIVYILYIIYTLYIIYNICV